jgi:hypothetical protein
MLERITKYVSIRCDGEEEEAKGVGWFGTNADIGWRRSFMAHPETLLPMSTIDDPVERFVSVIRFYLSGWHIKPPYVDFYPRPPPVVGSQFSNMTCHAEGSRNR